MGLRTDFAEPVNLPSLGYWYYYADHYKPDKDAYKVIIFGDYAVHFYKRDCSVAYKAFLLCEHGHPRYPEDVEFYYVEDEHGDKELDEFDKDKALVAMEGTIRYTGSVGKSDLEIYPSDSNKDIGGSEFVTLSDLYLNCILREAKDIIENVDAD